MRSKFAKVALRTSMIYAVVATVWILLSHWTLVTFVPDPTVLTRLGIYNDWAFGAVTALLLYAMLRGQLRHLEREATERKRVEEALRNSEERLRAVLEDQTEIICRFKADNTLTFVNDVFCRFFGKKREELLGSKWLPEAPPEDLPLVEKKVKSLSPANPIVLIENRVCSGSGEVRWMQFSNRAFFDGQNRLVEVQAVGRDITERKQAEEALRNSERLLRLVMDLVPHFIFVKDRQSRHLLVNRACAEATRLTAEQMVGLSDLDMAPGSPQAMAFMKDDQEVITTDRPKFTEEKLVDAKGRTRILQTTKIPFPSSTITFPVPGNGKPAILGVAVDITERKRAEVQLAESRNYLAKIINTIADPLFVKDRQHRWVLLNDAYCDFMGHQRDKLIGKSDYDFFPTNQAEVFWSKDEVVFTTGQENINEEEFTDGKGKLHTVMTKKALYTDEKGERFIVGVIRDITERTHAERVLQMFQFSIDQASDAIFWMTRDAGLTYVNEQACRSLGYTREELMRLHLWDFDPIFPKERWEAEWKQFQENRRGGSQQLETLHRRKDGSVFPVSISSKHLWFGDTELHVAVARDITERKQAEEANARLATAVEQAAEAIVITDTNGAILYVNPAFGRITGYTASEVIARNPRFLKSGKHDAAFYQQMWGALSHGQVWSGRVTNKKKNGALYEEEMSISPVFDSAGKITNYVAVKRDVTQEAALENQLRQAQKMEIIGQLAGGVAHDFNNILTVIQGNASLLLNTDLKPAEKTECTQQIIHAAGRAASLTRQLLLFSRKQIMQPTNVSLNEVVAQMTKMLRRVVGENISLQSNYAANLPFIHGDTGMIEQVLMNLVVNARDAMPAGGSLTIATGVKMVDQEEAAQSHGALPGLHVWLAVSDTGSGIATVNMPRIFEPFFTTKEVGKGTGLGLATVYGIVQQHHGWITLTSEVNKGTTFRIHFPAVPDAKPEKRAELLTA